MSKLSSGRRSHQEKRPERSKVFIFVEGLTEWHYFNGFKRDSRGSGIALEIPKTTLGRSGLRLVQESINYLEYHGKEDGDSVFVVFDRDSQFGGYAVTDANLVQIDKLARVHNIKVIFSDDAFELWFVLQLSTIDVADQ